MEVKKKEKTQITIISSEQGDITMGLAEIRKGSTINNGSILENLYEMDKYLDTHKSPKLTHEEIRIDRSPLQSAAGHRVQRCDSPRWPVSR